VLDLKATHECVRDDIDAFYHWIPTANQRRPTFTSFPAKAVPADQMNPVTQLDRFLEDRCFDEHPRLGRILRSSVNTSLQRLLGRSHRPVVAVVAVARHKHASLTVPVDAVAIGVLKARVGLVDCETCV
jgi:hypothetical protein